MREDGAIRRRLPHSHTHEGVFGWSEYSAGQLTSIKLGELSIQTVLLAFPLKDKCTYSFCSCPLHLTHHLHGCLKVRKINQQSLLRREKNFIPQNSASHFLHRPHSY